jgi:hypothetical protein
MSEARRPQAMLPSEHSRTHLDRATSWRAGLACNQGSTRRVQPQALMDGWGISRLAGAHAYPLQSAMRRAQAAISESPVSRQKQDASRAGPHRR